MVKRDCFWNSLELGWDRGPDSTADTRRPQIVQFPQGTTYSTPSGFHSACRLSSFVLPYPLQKAGAIIHRNTLKTKSRLALHVLRAVCIYPWLTAATYIDNQAEAVIKAIDFSTVPACTPVGGLRLDNEWPLCTGNMPGWKISVGDVRQISQ